MRVWWKKLWKDWILGPLGRQQTQTCIEINSMSNTALLVSIQYNYQKYFISNIFIFFHSYPININSEQKQQFY